MSGRVKRLGRWLPFLRWPRPDMALLRSEALAGLTVGLMVIPQAVAYASLAGMPLVTGLYASMLPALVAVLFSSSVRLSVGPTALSCLLIPASLAGLAEPGSTGWVTMAVWMALLSGALQIAMGWLKFGWLLNVVNTAVLTAFTQAAAVLIIGSQLSALLGWSDGIPWSHPVLPDVRSLVFGVGSLALLVMARRWRPTFPSVLVLVMASALISWQMGFEASGGSVVGALPRGFPTLRWPGWPGVGALQALLVPVLVVTMVSFLETASSAKVDNEREGRQWDQDQDLVGQGLAKLASGLSGAFPTSSSFSRSALNLYAGARTGWATVFSVMVVASALLWWLPVLHHVPRSVLAAIVVVAVIGLIKPRELQRFWQISRVEAAIAAVTFGSTLLMAPRLYWGVLIGVLLSLIHFLYLRLHPRIIEVGQHEDGRLRDRHLWALAPWAPDTFALRMDAALDFGSAAAFERTIIGHVVSHPSTRFVAWMAQPVNRIDATGVETFARIRRFLSDHGVVWVIVGMKLPVEKVLCNAGEWSPDDSLIFCVSEAEALRWLQAATGEPVAVASMT